MFDRKGGPLSHWNQEDQHFLKSSFEDSFGILEDPSFPAMMEKAPKKTGRDENKSCTDKSHAKLSHLRQFVSVKKPNSCLTFVFET